MNSFDLKIVATNRVFYEGKCLSLTIPCVDGEKEILAHHEEMLIAMKVGNLRLITEEGEKIEAVVGMGFTEVTREQVLVITDTAERPEEIDEVRARQAKERAEEQLRQQQSIQEYYHSRASLARAIARLKGKKLH